MTTIKLPYTFSEDITTILKQYSSIVHYSYNRLLEGSTEKDIRALIKGLNNIETLNSWIIQCGIRDAKAIRARTRDSKIVFGGKFNLRQRLKGKISKEEYRLKRLMPINIQGEELYNGNRCFKLDIIENNRIIFKLSKNKHIEFKLPALRPNFKKSLHKLQELNNVKYRNKGYTYTVRFDLKYIYIMFKEFKEPESILKESRYIGIDMNPDTIGISVLDNGKVLHAQEFSLKKIFGDTIGSSLASDSLKMKYFQNKLKFETLEISKSISQLAKQFKCKSVFIEDLEFKNPLSIKVSNRKNKNLWKRTLFVSNLNKRLHILGVNLYKINPAYSSFIGNLQHEYTDAINASIEIARRGSEYHLRKNTKGFYPPLAVKHRWKKMATTHTEWKSLFSQIKNSKLKYRVSLNEVSKYNFKVFKQNSSHKSRVLNYSFYG